MAEFVVNKIGELSLNLVEHGLPLPEIIFDRESEFQEFMIKVKAELDITAFNKIQTSSSSCVKIFGVKVSFRRTQA